jgi:hypothetical protein
MADLEFFTQNVRFRVDGKSYVGCMDINALGELQKLWGVANLADMQSRVENVGFPEMMDIVFVSLLRDQPKMTRKDSDALASTMGMNGIVSYVSEVMKAGSAPKDVVPTRRVRRAARKSR